LARGSRTQTEAGSKVLRKKELPELKNMVQFPLVMFLEIPRYELAEFEVSNSWEKA